MSSGSAAGLALLTASPATAVQHCASAYLTLGERADSQRQPALPDLVISRGSSLEVYTMREEHCVDMSPPAATQPASRSSNVLDGVRGAQLHLVTRLELNAKVESLRTIASPLGMARDKLLLAFADAKLSIVEFEPSSRTLRTAIAHSFEGLAREGGCFEARFPPLLRVHPGGACAALLAYSTQLMLLPLLGGAATAAAATNGEAGRPSAALASHAAVAARGPTAGLHMVPVLPINHIAGMTATTAGTAQPSGAAARTDAAVAAPASTSVDIVSSRLNLHTVGLKHARDLAFLDGYAEPVLAVLCEPEQTWSGRLAFLSDTCIVRAMQLSARRVVASTLWEVKGLPHDTTSVLPLPLPCGGLLALSDNALFWLSAAHRFGLALNRDASCGCLPKLNAVPSTTRISLRGASATVVYNARPLTVALSLATGELYLAKIQVDGRGVNGIDLVKVVASVPASCACTIAERYLFLGSVVADSLLLQLFDPLRGDGRQGPTAAIDARAAHEGAAPAPVFAEGGGRGGSKKRKWNAATGGANGDDTTVAVISAAAVAHREEGDGEDDVDAVLGLEGGAGAEEEQEREIELRLYGCGYSSSSAPPTTAATRAPAVRRTRVQVALRDSLVSTAPISDSVVLQPLLGGFEALLCGGRGRSGSITHVSRGIVLQSLAAFDVPPSEAIFSLRMAAAPALKETPEMAVQEGRRRLLLSGAAGGSTVLEAGEEISEVTRSSGLFIGGPTLYLAPLLGGTHVVQFYAGGVRWMRGDATLFEQPPPAGRTIVRGSASDLYALALLDDGTPCVFEPSVDRETLTPLDVPSPAAGRPSPSRLLSATLFEDTLGVFAQATSLDDAACAGAGVALATESGTATAYAKAGPSLGTLAAAAVGQQAAKASAADGRTALEDAVLYARSRCTPYAAAAVSRPVANEGAATAAATAAASTLCVSLDAEGRFCVWRLPGWECVFTSPSALLQGASLVTDADQGAAARGAEEEEADVAAATASLVHSLVEVRLVSMKADCRPLLALIVAPARQVRQPGRLLLYRPFNWDGWDGARHVRFARVSHNATPRFTWQAAHGGEDDDPLAAATSRNSGGGEASPLRVPSSPPRCVPLESFGGLEAPLEGSLLVLAEPPTLLVMIRDAVFAHDLRLPAADVQSIRCAAPLHVPGYCPHGVVLMSPEGRLHVCSLRRPPPNAQPTRYDCAWPLTKMGLRATGHAISLVPHMNSLVVGVSTSELLPDASLSATEMHGVALDPVAALPSAARYADRYELRLLDLESWETLDTHVLREHEWVMAMQHMVLTHEFAPPSLPPNQQMGWMRQFSQAPPPERAPVVVVGTAFVRGEDSSCTGRVLLLQVKDATAEEQEEAIEALASGEAPKASTLGRRLEVIVEHEERGPVLSLACLSKDGLLLAGVGPKLMTWVYKDRGLVALGFHIAGFGVSALATLQNYVLAGDVQEGIQLLTWKAERQSLVLVSRYPSSSSAYACEFVLHEGALHLALAEEGPTLRTLNYARAVAESRRGTLLLPRSASHLSSPITRLHRLVLGAERTMLQRQSPRTALLWTAADGSLGFAAPLDEAPFRRLARLATKMVVGAEHACALHPRAFRALRNGASSAKELDNMVDGELVGRYTALGEAQQQRLAMAIGSTVAKVHEALAEAGRCVV